MRFLFLLLACFFQLYSAAAGKELRGTVSWIYDGDTLKIEKIGKVRLLGIDCPESIDSERDLFYLKNYSISRKTLRQVAQQAKRFNIEQVKGKQVRLRFDTDQKDRYGRLLAYLYLPDGTMLNKLLIEKGLATTYRRYHFQEQESFLAAEKLAHAKFLGLWQK